MFRPRSGLNLKSARKVLGTSGVRKPGIAADVTQGRRLLVLHVFVKKTQATPRKAIDTARQRLENLA